jgi:hypothetical protein
MSAANAIAIRVWAAQPAALSIKQCFLSPTVKILHGLLRIARASKRPNPTRATPILVKIEYQKDT